MPSCMYSQIVELGRQLDDGYNQVNALLYNALRTSMVNKSIAFQWNQNQWPFNQKLGAATMYFSISNRKKKNVWVFIYLFIKRNTMVVRSQRRGNRWQQRLTLSKMDINTCVFHPCVSCIRFSECFAGAARISPSVDRYNGWHVQFECRKRFIFYVGLKSIYCFAFFLISTIFFIWFLHILYTFI